MAELDQGVENLEKFNALLQATVSRLQEQNEAMESEAAALDRREDETGGRLEEFNDAIEGLEEAFDGQRGEAGEAVEELTGAATTGETRLTDADQRIDERASSLEEALARDGETVESAWSRLESEGFEPSEAALTKLVGDVETDEGEAQQAFDDAGSGLDSARQDAEAARDEAEQAASSFSAAAADLQGAAQEVAALASRLDAATGEVEGAVESLAGDMDQAYEELATDAGAATDALVAEVSSLLEESAAELGQDEADLEQKLAAVADGSTAELVTTLTQTETLVATGAETTEPCGTLVPELARSREVAAEVDRLLENMA